jgi:hypothetical protein
MLPSGSARRGLELVTEDVGAEGEWNNGNSSRIPGYLESTVGNDVVYAKVTVEQVGKS